VALKIADIAHTTNDITRAVSYSLMAEKKINKIIHNASFHNLVSRYGCLELEKSLVGFSNHPLAFSQAQ
jgi:hypothetical protein